MKLQVQNLICGYTKQRDILHGVTLEIAEGQAVGIIGLNGSGKSTLARAVMNMLPFRQGRILFNGEDVTRMTTTELSRVGITLFMQGGRVFDELTVMENLRFAMKPGVSLDEVPDFQCLPNKRADQLSGGERHRLALAMCLLREPQLLILDEPSAGLAPHAVDEIYRTLTVLREKKNLTLLLIEQNIARAMNFCDSVNLLRDGDIVKRSDNRSIGEIEQVLFN